MTRKRLAAFIALVAAAATVALAAVQTGAEFPRMLVLTGCVAGAALTAWHSVLRKGRARTLGLAIAGLATAAVVIVVVTGGPLWAELAIVAGGYIFFVGGRGAPGHA